MTLFEGYLKILCNSIKCSVSVMALTLSMSYMCCFTM